MDFIDAILKVIEKLEEIIIPALDRLDEEVKDIKRDMGWMRDAISGFQIEIMDLHKRISNVESALKTLEERIILKVKVEYLQELVVQLRNLLDK